MKINRHLGAWTFFIFILIIITAEYFSSIGSSNYPKPSSIFQILIDYLTSIFFWKLIFITLIQCLLGCLAATVLMIPLGILFGLNNKIKKTFHPFIEVLRPIPSAALIPILLILYGHSNWTYLTVIAYGSAWPILLNTISGIEAIDAPYKRVLFVYNISKLKALRFVIFPAALPSVFTGVRISLSIALILTITVELVLGQRGLGGYLKLQGDLWNTQAVYTIILVIGLIGLAINRVFFFFEQKHIFWHFESRSVKTRI